MQRPYRHIEHQVQDGVFCARIKTSLHEEALENFGAELGRLIDEEGCRKMVLVIGPHDLDCLYSVFLAKLIYLQRRLESVGGSVALAEASANTQEVFRVTGLDRYFKFYADHGSAMRALAS
jgi:anti-anti-sigma factor